MKYISLIFILFPVGYLLSFAKYTWRVNKLSAIGSIIIAVLAIGLPFMVIFTK